jgi:hypothetical protein
MHCQPEHYYYISVIIKLERRQVFRLECILECILHVTERPPQTPIEQMKRFTTCKRKITDYTKTI